MTSVEEDRRIAAEYVLGTLDAAERTALRARIADDPAFGALVRMWEMRFAPLHELAVTAPAPVTLWNEILAALPVEPVAEETPAEPPLEETAENADPSPAVLDDASTLDSPVFDKPEPDAPALTEPLAPLPEDVSTPAGTQPEDGQADSAPLDVPEDISTDAFAPIEDERPEPPAVHSADDAVIDEAVLLSTPDGFAAGLPPSEPAAGESQAGETIELPSVGEPEPEAPPAEPEASVVPPEETVVRVAALEEEAVPAPEPEKPPPPRLITPAPPIVAPIVDEEPHRNPWRIASGLLALALLAGGIVVAYRETKRPVPLGFFAVLHPQPAAGVALTVEPAAGIVSVLQVPEAAPDGMRYNLWVSSPTLGTRRIGAFREAGRVQTREFAPLGRAALSEATLILTLEPEGADAASPTGETVFSGRLVPR